MINNGKYLVLLYSISSVVFGIVFRCLDVLETSQGNNI